MKNLSTFLVLGLMLPLPAVAQSQTAPSTSKPALEVSFLGPAAWRTRFAPTNVGSLLASEAVHGVWETQLAQLEQIGKDSLGSGNSLFQVLKDQSGDYGGEVRILGWSSVPGDEENGPPAFGIVFGPDGKTDLAKMARMLTDVIEKAAEMPWEEKDFGDRKLKVITDDGETICAPVIEDEKIWMIYGARNFAGVIEQVRSVRLSKPAGDASPMTARLDIQAVLTADRKPKVEEIASMGVSSIKQLQLQIRPAGPQVSLELSAEFMPGQDRRVLAAFMPGTSTMSWFASMIPESVTACMASHLDATRLYRELELAVSELERTFRLFESEEDMKKRPDLETIRKKNRELATAELGLDPVDGILVHLGTDGLICGNLEDIDAHGQILIAMRLRDEKAFKVAFEKVLEKGKGFINKAEDIDYDGVNFSRYGITLLGNAYCAVGRGMIVIAGGDDGEGQMKRFLDAAKKQAARPESDRAAGLPAEFSALARHLPPGCNTVGASTIGLTLQLILSGARDVLGPALGAPFPIKALDEESLASLSELLKEHHLDRVRAMAGYSEDTWRMRIFW